MSLDIKRWGGFLLKSLLGMLALVLIPMSEVDASVSFDHVVVDDGGLGNIWLKTIGDINGDGQTDLIAGGNAAGGLVWYQAPAWEKHIISAEGGFGTDGEVADVDGDGDQDVVVLTDHDLRWYENPDWDVHIIDERPLHDVEVGDLDGDGDVDLVARNQGEFGSQGNELHLYRQDTPTLWTHRSVDCTNGEGLKLVDVDGDGDQDIVIGGTWFENEQNILNASWAAYSYTTSWDYPNAFVGAGDINGDGRVDIALAPSELAGGSYRISWFASPVDPKSGDWPEHIVEDNVETVQHFIGVADMDGDGDLDIAAAEMQQGEDPDEVKVYLNQDGAGASWMKQVLSTDGSHSMRILDVGNDGDNDLFGANWEGNQVELWLNQGCQASLDNWERHVIDPDKPWRAIFITAGDMDQDGLQDIISGGSWYKNPGSPGGEWVRETIGEPLNNMAAVYDFDGDGLLDVLGTMGQGSDSNPRFVWAHNNGSGSFSVLGNIDPGDGDFLQGVAVGSLEAGGALKVGLSWHTPGYGVQMLSVPAQPLTDTWTIEQISASSQDEALSLGDIDHDGDQDLLLGTRWLENGGPSWIEHILHDTNGAPYGESDPDRNRLADINNDGRLDALVGYEAISVPGKLAWYEQGEVATGIWQEHVIATVVGPMSLDVADVDQDGDLDVIVGEHNLDDPASAHLFVFENVDGIGTQWQEHVVYQGDEHHDGAQVIDIDNDGDLDIISIGWEQSAVILYENKSVRCGNSPGTPTDTPTTPTLVNTSVAPTSVPTDTNTPTPAPSGGPLSCLPGSLLLAGIVLAIIGTRHLLKGE